MTDTSSLLDEATRDLGHASVHPARREARWMLEYVCNAPRPPKCVTAQQADEFRALIARRCAREPLQYLLGMVEFDGLELEVTPDVLIPRPETEEMVAIVCRRVRDTEAELTCADLGTGSGCLAVALAARLPRSQWYACDCSSAALEVARHNAARHGVNTRIEFRCGDWYAALPAGQQFDLIVSNPPYVEDDAELEPELAFEPAGALYAGGDGLDAYRVVLKELGARLAPGGVFVSEMGLNQGQALTRLARANGLPAPQFACDGTGRERFTVICA